MEEKEILLETGTNELEILEFYIDQKTESDPDRCYFGMNVAKVMQVIESPNLERVDYAPHPCFLGTIPLRHHILPVLDLSIWLGLPRQRDRNEVVIVTEFSNAVTGFLVSGVTEIHRVGWKEVTPPSGYFAAMALGCLIGTVRRHEHFIQLLDLESILSDLDPASMKMSGFEALGGRQTYRALVADDSPTIRVMIRNNLKAAKLVPRLVTNGEEAFALLQRLKEEAASEGRDITDLVDVVISDIEMPLMDGFTLTRMIKEDPVLRKLPVILYSSIITDELRHKGESVKADDQVSKPEMHMMAERAIRLIEAR